jgi:hypothetical protein
MPLEGYATFQKEYRQNSLDHLAKRESAVPHMGDTGCSGLNMRVASVELGG